MEFLLHLLHSEGKKRSAQEAGVGDDARSLRNEYPTYVAKHYIRNDLYEYYVVYEKDGKTIKQRDYYKNGRLYYDDVPNEARQSMFRQIVRARNPQVGQSDLEQMPPNVFANVYRDFLPSKIFTLCTTSQTLNNKLCENELFWAHWGDLQGSEKQWNDVGGRP